MTGKKKGSKEKEERTCGYRLRDCEPCGRSLYDDKFCIFHSKDIERKENKFNDAFWKEFERQKKHKKKYDFTGFVFPYISFTGNEFENDTVFKCAKFSGEVNFWDVQFSGVADFTHTKFSEVAFFEGAKFSGVADFTFSKFSGAADFTFSKFSGPTIFSTVQFSGGAIFNKAKFKENTDFKNIKIKKYNSFEMIDTYFFNVSGLFEFIEENKKVFKNLKKRSKTLKTEFLPKNFKLILGEETIARYPTQSRQIKDDMYLLDKRERNSIMKGIKKCWYKSLYFLWWLFANYGRSFKRWAAWSIGFAVLFALIYTGLYGNNHANFNTVYVNDKCPFLSFLYYSIVTFTTLGFGDIVPRTDLLQFWVALEVILGYIMLGGLISILANKMARRS